MKKTYSTVLALLIAATVSAYTTTAQAGIFGWLFYKEPAAQAISKEPAAQAISFDKVMEQLTDKNAGNDYIDSDQTPDFMVTIITKHDDALKKFLALLTTKSIRTDYCEDDCHYMVREILTELLAYKQIVPTIATIFNQNLQADKMAIISENLGRFPKKILEKITIIYPPAISLFINTAVNNIKKIPCQIIKILYNKSQGVDRKKLEDAFKKINISNTTFFKAFIKHRTKYFLLKHLKKITPTTQSEHHINANKREIKQAFPKIAHNKKARKTFCRLHKKEKAEHKKGRYTFVHAQKWQWHFYADLFKKLWEIRYNEQISDYHFLRFEPKSADLAQEKTKREQAMTDQDTYNWHGWGDNKNSAGRLFMNHAIFGNVGWNGNCSAWYWLNNHDYSHVPFSVQDLLEKLNLQKYYKKYEKEFAQLQKLHRESSTYGNILLISFTQEQLKKCVIVADGHGHTTSSTCIDGKQTDNVKRIIDALKSDPKRLEDSNHVQYCMMLTHDCALDPHNGPRIYSFNAPDKKKFKQYTQLREDIFNQIAHDVAADRKK